jgi:DNA-binding ferritin-like protein
MINPPKFKSTNNSSTKIGEFISKLFASRTQIHILHLNTKSFEVHKALNDYYDSVIPLADSIAESYQGKMGIITGYTQEPIDEKADPVAYLTTLVNWIESNRQQVSSSSYIQNQIDGTVELCYETLYKLKNLN